MTLREMCEIIAQAGILKKKDGAFPTWEEIFNYSPRGELFMIWVWYEQAELLYELIRNEQNK